MRSYRQSSLAPCAKVSAVSIDSALPGSPFASTRRGSLLRAEVLATIHGAQLRLLDGEPLSSRPQRLVLLAGPTLSRVTRATR